MPQLLKKGLFRFFFFKIFFFFEIFFTNLTIYLFYFYLSVVIFLISILCSIFSKFFYFYSQKIFHIQELVKGIYLPSKLIFTLYFFSKYLSLFESYLIKILIFSGILAFTIFALDLIALTSINFIIFCAND